MSENLLPMSYRRARKFFENIAKREADRVGENIYLDESKPCLVGKTRDDALFGDGGMTVGFSSFQYSSKNGFGFDDVDGVLFVGTYVAINHELRHHEVFEELKQAVAAKDITLSHIAKQGSNAYYKGNRYRFVTEIDAEWAGILDTYAAMEKLDSPIEVERLICNYVNHQCKNFTYYINRHPSGEYKSISEINNAFAEAYELATSKEPVVRDEYGLPDKNKRYREIRPSWKDDEAIAQCLDEQGRLKPEFQPVFDMMWDASNADKDRMMASLTLNAMPELKQFYGERVADELRPEKVFGDVWSSSVQRGAENRERVDMSLVNDVGDELDHQLE